MEKADIMEKVEGYLEEKNYLAACLYLKNEELPDESRYELTGEVAKYVVEDLASERNKEKILYLRSVLVWLFKDIPGLASVYREQLRLASGGPNLMRDFVRGVRNFSEFGSGAETFLHTPSRRGMANPCTAIDIVGADHGTNKFLHEVVFLIGTSRG